MALSRLAGLLLCHSLLTSLPAREPWQTLEAGAEFRPRYESRINSNGSDRNNDFRASGVDNNNDYLYLRTSLWLRYIPDEELQFYFMGRDNHVFSDERENSPRQDRLDFFQGYIQLGGGDILGWRFRIGRQELEYGSRILVGAPNYDNGRSFDAVRGQYETGGWRLDGYLGRVAIPDSRDINLSSNSEYSWAVTLMRSMGATGAEFFTGVFARHEDAGRSFDAGDIYAGNVLLRQRPGNESPWDFLIEGIYQIGTLNPAGERIQHRAWLAQGELGYTFREIPWSPRLLGKILYSPGDDDPFDDRNRTFVNLYNAGNNARQGRADLMGWRNTLSYMLGADIQPLDNLRLEARYYFFFLDDTRDFFYNQTGPGRVGGGYGANERFSKFIGNESNLRIVYNVKKWLRLEAVFGYFQTGTYIEQSLRSFGGDADATYFRLDLRFRF